MSEIPSHGIGEFFQAVQERDQPGDRFELESPRMLEAHVNGRIWCKLGSMIAYRGDLKFRREGVLERGLGQALLKAISSETSPLTKVEGQGRVYLADTAKEVSILKLNNDAIHVSGNDLLAFEDTITSQITMHRRVAGMMSGGLFSARLSGQGLVAITTHGQPLALQVTPNDPVFTDPNATVAWSDGLAPEIKTDISFKTLMGRGGGESFQMMFRGSGFVVVQPFEEVPVVTTNAS